MSLLRARGVVSNNSPGFTSLLASSVYVLIFRRTMQVVRACRRTAVHASVLVNQRWILICSARGRVKIQVYRVRVTFSWLFLAVQSAGETW